MAMSGAHDWTIDIERKGLPELKQIYGSTAGPTMSSPSASRSSATTTTASRGKLMYEWFNAHLGLGHKIAHRRGRTSGPSSRRTVHVFDAKHPRPADAGGHQGPPRKEITAVAKTSLPSCSQRRRGLPHYREVVGTAARVMLDNADLPDPEPIDVGMTAHDDLERRNGAIKGIAVRSDDKTKLPWVLLRPKRSAARPSCGSTERESRTSSAPTASRPGRGAKAARRGQRGRLGSICF